MSKRTVDLNCDMGESFGRYTLGRDEDVMPLITSANIACGFHAGDPHVMRKTVELAAAHNVGIGAHPGLPDLLGFGRRKMAITPQDLHDLFLYQIGALDAFARAVGRKLQHVKMHGALFGLDTLKQDERPAVAADPAFERSVAGIVGGYRRFAECGAPEATALFVVLVRHVDDDRCKSAAVHGAILLSRAARAARSGPRGGGADVWGPRRPQAKPRTAAGR